jgi:hypothetical protein
VEPVKKNRRSTKHKRYNRPVPGDRVQMDVTKVGPKTYQYTAITTARGIWALEEIITFFDPVHSPSAVIHGFGYYHERYKKSAGQWRITGYRLERLKLDYTPWHAVRNEPA